MHAISSYRGNGPTNPPTDKTDYNTLCRRKLIRTTTNTTVLKISPGRERYDDFCSGGGGVEYEVTPLRGTPYILPRSRLFPRSIRSAVVPVR